MAEHAVAPPTPVTPITPDTLMGVTALARFEFEAGRGNEGTKVMMVEWQDDQSRHQQGTWHVSWSGKRTVFPADDRPSDKIRRSYFLIPPSAAVPPHLTLAYQSPIDAGNAPSEALKMTVKPLPAIFTPELGATAKASGKKGVLHTIWAKKRLQSLEREIQREQEHNLEGIALEMAIAERDWIQDNFGLQTKPAALDISAATSAQQSASVSPSAMPPQSPNSHRLSEKLKGLSLGTSEKDLAARANTPTSELHPLSPEVSDMAYSSFSAFRADPASPKSASRTTPKRMTAQAPPASILQQQAAGESGPSLNFISNIPSLTETGATTSDDPDDLFAVALSPRSPDLAKSPFSFSSAEVSKARAERQL
ncbi:uncharacterized protein HMPREF1541_06535 [Cyphellophora europaea CBS 101466]|uniref:Uncharacterized protein n=1 Tax=Cyphellophora europaea (strain CBS 101466) TaxID=1220924 RepID=W2RQA9_CYPE1|nr:uncharacterized protein HMPREF1541_06535 [Cyphellophora europaea CBS 101466]ETN38500.1 hypothetical protein HMPREF1541_06535 [Cyphellophora europaea CBS 101466]